MTEATATLDYAPATVTERVLQFAFDRRMDGFTFPDLAADTGWTVNAAKARIGEARDAGYLMVTDTAVTAGHRYSVYRHTEAGIVRLHRLRCDRGVTGPLHTLSLPSAAPTPESGSEDHTEADAGTETADVPARRPRRAMILDFIARNGSAATTDLAAMLDTERKTVAAAMVGLREGGLVNAEPFVGAAHRYTLTEAGAAALDTYRSNGVI